MTVDKNLVMHIDMNSYFASVEQQANPFLRGRPVGVCAYLSPRGCIIASSIEAKARGVKTGCRVDEAKHLCPDIVLIENDPGKYLSTTERIFGILRDYSDKVEPYSIDEAFVDFTGWQANPGAVEEIARAIKARVKSEAGEWLECSIGISWTRFLAKFAGDIAPKRSILLIENVGQLESVLRGRPLQDAWGINHRMEARLKALGINDLGDLHKYDPDRLRRSLGSYGYYLWANVNGIEINKVRSGTAAPKSIGHSYCLPRQTTDKDFLGKVLYKLCEKTGRKLRNRGLEAGNVSVYVSYVHGDGFGKTAKTEQKIFTTKEIFTRTDKILRDTQLLRAVRSLAVSVGKLSPASGQMSLFDDNLAKRNLSLALDKINDRYGEYTVFPGEMFGTADMARERIGFRKTISFSG